MGGKSPKAKVSPYEQTLADIATQQWERISPLQQDVIGQLSAFTEGDLDVSQLPQYKYQYQSLRPNIESQYNVARENLMGSVPRGGALTEQLANLETSRAAQLGEMPSMISNQLIQDLENKAYGAAFQVPQSAMQGLGAVSGTYGSRQSAEMAAQAQRYGSTLGGLGQAAGAAGTLYGLKSLGGAGAGAAGALGGTAALSSAAAPGFLAALMGG